jgi:hypothetical protein
MRREMSVVSSGAVGNKVSVGPGHQPLVLAPSLLSRTPERGKVVYGLGTMNMLDVRCCGEGILLMELSLFGIHGHEC